MEFTFLVTTSDLEQAADLQKIFRSNNIKFEMSADATTQRLDMPSDLVKLNGNGKATALQLDFGNEKPERRKGKHHHVNGAVVSAVNKAKRANPYATAQEIKAIAGVPHGLSTIQRIINGGYDSTGRRIDHDQDQATH